MPVHYVLGCCCLSYAHCACLCVGAEQNVPKEGKQYRWGAPYTVQLRVLLQRTLKTRRFEALSSRDFLQFLIVGVLAGELH